MLTQPRNLVGQVSALFALMYQKIWIPLKLVIEFVEPLLKSIGGQHKLCAGSCSAEGFHVTEKVHGHALSILLLPSQLAALFLQKLRCIFPQQIEWSHPGMQDAA